MCLFIFIHNSSYKTENVLNWKYQVCTKCINLNVKIISNVFLIDLMYTYGTFGECKILPDLIYVLWNYARYQYCEFVIFFLSLIS